MYVMVFGQFPASRVGAIQKGSNTKDSENTPKYSHHYKKQTTTLLANQLYILQLYSKEMPYLFELAPTSNKRPSWRQKKLKIAQPQMSVLEFWIPVLRGIRIYS